jgi:hypothetical protein
MFLKSSLHAARDMRTNQQQNKLGTMEITMLNEILAIARRNQDTLLTDLAGVAALVVMLMGALHLPTVL